MISLLIASITAIVLAQFSSFLVKSFAAQSPQWKELINTGGFPSSHAAFVSCVAAGVFILQGISPLFVVSLALCLVVLSDAVGVRRQVGFLSREINSMKKKKVFNESAGHTPLQVAAGVLLGIILAVILV